MINWIDPENEMPEKNLYSFPIELTNSKGEKLIVSGKFDDATTKWLDDDGYELECGGWTVTGWQPLPRPRQAKPPFRGLTQEETDAVMGYPSESIEDHTPGPWKCGRSDPSEQVDCWWLSNKDGYFLMLSQANIMAPIRQADAHLIASAPDLVAENKRLRERTIELEREREEADFLYYEGGEESVASLVDENKRLREELKAVVDAYGPSNRPFSLMPNEAVERARKALEGGGDG